MAAPMWRMNGVWRRLAGLLVLCTLLLSNEVMSQDSDSIVSTGEVPVLAAEADATTAINTDVSITGSNPTAAASRQSSTPAPSSLPSIAGRTAVNTNIEDSSGGSTLPVTREETTPAPKNHDQPAVSCVPEDKISSPSVTFEVETTDCQDTEGILMKNSAIWCKTGNCDLKINQNGKKLLVAADDIKREVLADALKEKLSMPQSSSPQSSSSGSSVFVGLLVSGLLVAIGITLFYCKRQRRTDPKGEVQVEQASPVDQENQGNTLVYHTPLNPPAETQEKPSVNGESNEEAKTQPPPPTNGHPATKTADTEM